MKHVKNSIILCMLLLGMDNPIIAQTISPYIIGNNYWYPGGNAAALMAPGKEMQTAGFKMIRIGGFGANDYSNANFITYIDAVHAMGAEPQVQVAAAKSDQQVIDLITYINVTMKRRVKYWSIGNEPEHPSGGNLSDATVAAYTKRIAPLLKAIDPTIKVIALETSGYVGSWLDKMLDGSLDLTGKDANGRYYIDIISWHNYGWNDNPYAVVSQMDDMVARLAKANATRTDSPISWMMGECNTHWDNTKATDDRKVWSFRAGQSYAIIYGAAMARNAHSITFWSIYEGKNYCGSADRGCNDLSLFDIDNVARSNYWHSLMLGQNMRSNYAVSSDNNSNIATVAMKDANGVSVMIMNKNTTTPYTLAAKLDASTFTSTQAVNINVDASINMTYTDQIAADATIMLIFNNLGQLTKRYTYTGANALARTAPKVETFTVNPVIITHVLPSKIEAEEYSNVSGLELETVVATEGIGQDLGYTTIGDWVEYKVDAKYDGEYQFDFRVASLNGNASLSLLSDNTTLISNVTIEATGGWQVWKTISTKATLSKGLHTFKVNVVKDGFNLNWIDVTFLPKNPVVSFVTPQNNAQIKQGDDLAVKVNATQDQGIASVQLYLDNVLVSQENIASYDWNGTTDPVLKTLSVGPHTLKAIATTVDIEGKTTTAESSIIIQVTSIVTSIDEFDTNKQLTVSPQPFSSSTTLKLSDGATLQSISILNHMGQEVEVLSGGNASQITLGGNLAAGMYNLMIKTSEGMYSAKIVKQ